ncbi:putative RNA-directed DNA polymerase from transposon BS [Trichonephila clavipes]|nr:putative RNA-directed DNA polymerase from transposon BS [Trichonephila clavipes]
MVNARLVYQLEKNKCIPLFQSASGLHYTWTIYRSVVKVRTCLIERQLQTAVNNIVKWCDTNGHSISASKSCCVHFCRKRVVKHLFGGRIEHHYSECQSGNRTRIDYGCVAYGSACNSTAKLTSSGHMALRICSGAFRTSPVQSLYVNRHQLPL